eukprot:3751953-Rhodomonas_salina.1
MSGTKLGHAAARCLLRDVRYWPRLCCYRTSGTDLDDAATKCPVLTWTMLLPGSSGTRAVTARYDPRSARNQRHKPGLVSSGPDVEWLSAYALAGCWVVLG